MDPLLLEALRFGLAILAGGLVAVVSSVLAFRYAQQLQREAREHEAAAARSAIAVELEENLARLERHAAEKWPAHPTRLAWDTARGVDLGPAGESVIAAYRELELLAMRVDQAWRFSTSSTGPDGILRDTAAKVDPAPAIGAVRRALEAIAAER